MSVEVLAKTIYGEARGQAVLDRLAVGAVIRERALRPGWWGRGFEGVCLAPYQFSCWNEGDPNREAIEKAEQEDRKVYFSCLTLAEYVMTHFKDQDAVELFGPGPFPTHYHDLSIDKPKGWGEAEEVRTSWASGFKFYRGLDGTPGRSETNRPAQKEVLEVNRTIDKDDLEREIRDIRWTSSDGELGERQFLEDDVQAILDAVWNYLKEA